MTSALSDLALITLHLFSDDVLLLVVYCLKKEIRNDKDLFCIVSGKYCPMSDCPIDQFNKQFLTQSLNLSIKNHLTNWSSSINIDLLYYYIYCCRIQICCEEIFQKIHNLFRWINLNNSNKFLNLFLIICSKSLKPINSIKFTQHSADSTVVCNWQLNKQINNTVNILE